MKTGDLAKIFGVSDTTIRNWHTTYANFFSTQTGFQRVFSTSDVDVFATIAKLSKEGLTAAQIQHKLESGERHSPESLIGSGVITEFVAKEAVTGLIDSAQIRMERDQLAETVAKLAEDLRAAQQKNEQQADEYKQQTQEVIRLTAELNYLKGKLEALEEKKKGWFG